jgi:hypothetical protein
MQTDYREMYSEEVSKNEKLHEVNEALAKELKALRLQIKNIEKAVTQTTRRNMELESQVSTLKSILNNSGNNSGIPTSRMGIDQSKRIPNTRETTNRKIGGQYGHKKSKLESFSDEEVTDYIYHQETNCSNCSSEMVATGVEKTKDEYEIVTTVKKKRHVFMTTKCMKCDQERRPSIPNHLKEDNQYGFNIQAIAISLMNQGFVSMIRTKELMLGMSNGLVDLSVGYISKLQKRIATNLTEFMFSLRQMIISQAVIHWDDTVIMINKKRACLRVYVADGFTYFVAHEKKNKEGLDQDAILCALDAQTVVVHDHNKVNYNETYDYLNAECCVHLLRDLQKVVDNTKHSWAKDLKRLLSDTNVKRSQGESYEACEIISKYDELINLGFEQNSQIDYDTEIFKIHYLSKEKTLLERLKKYKVNYLMWLTNPMVPFSNNESERCLRSSKTKMKVSGQFQNIKSAEYFSIIRSYIETGRRHGFNPIYLITRVLTNQFITLDEMIHHKQQQIT